MSDRDEKRLLKDSLGERAVRHLAATLRAADPSFDARAFARTATRGMSELELKARVQHVIAALREHLPSDVLEALDVLVRAADGWERDPDDTFSVFTVWPMIDFVGVHGLAHPEEGLAALRRLTPLFSAEFAIRPFLEQDQAGVLARLAEWTDDPDEHVRRLVSEGTRPRLPWGGRLRALQADPTPALPLLEALKDDPSEYVRRSVANHLNDIAKDHPELVVETCARWSEGATEARARLIRHALRTLVKAGHLGALAVLGFDPEPRVALADLRVSPSRLKLGGHVTVRFELVSEARRAQPLVVDYAVHHVKKSGARTAKVFKLKTLTLEPGARVAIEKRHALKRISTRRYHSGVHTVEILVNGRARASADFRLQVPR